MLPYQSEPLLYLHQSHSEPANTTAVNLDITTKIEFKYNHGEVQLRVPRTV